MTGATQVIGSVLVCGAVIVFTLVVADFMDAVRRNVSITIQNQEILSKKLNVLMDHLGVPEDEEGEDDDEYDSN